MPLIYVNEESAITWRNTGGSALFTPTSLATGAGRQGALHDFGVAARPLEHAWRAFVKFATAPVIGEVIEIYWKTSDGTNPDNDDGTGDAAVTSINKLLNLGPPIGFIVVDEAASAPVFSAGGYVEIPHRWGAPVFWNATADALSATATDHGFQLTPIPMETQ